MGTPWRLAWLIKPGSVARANKWPVPVGTGIAKLAKQAPILRARPVTLPLR